MTADQRKVALGASTGIISMLVTMTILYHLIPPRDDMAGIAERIAHAARWTVVASLPLLFAIVSVGNRRFATPAIDPTLGKEDETIRINARVVANTLEQFALFAAATLALAVALPPEMSAIIAAAALTFLVARSLFWIGYRIHPLYRAFGMAATSYLNLCLIGAALWFNRDLFF